jgi:hypothetical protein
MASQPTGQHRQPEDFICLHLSSEYEFTDQLELEQNLIVLSLFCVSFCITSFTAVDCGLVGCNAMWSCRYISMFRSGNTATASIFSAAAVGLFLALAQ